MQIKPAGLGHHFDGGPGSVEWTMNFCNPTACDVQPGNPAVPLLCKGGRMDFLDASTVRFEESQFGFVMDGYGANGYGVWHTTVHILCDTTMAEGQVRCSVRVWNVLHAWILRVH